MRYLEGLRITTFKFNSFPYKIRIDESFSESFIIVVVSGIPDKRAQFIAQLKAEKQRLKD
jgi:hypothetical protein